MPPTFATRTAPTQRCSTVGAPDLTLSATAWAAGLACLLLAPPAMAQEAADANGASYALMNARGVSGGLSIPNAWTLPGGTLAAGYSDFVEPKAKYSARPRHQNYVVGLGLLPHIEIAGRLAEYTTPYVSTTIMNGWVVGTRDLSANIKVQLPRLLPVQPDVAVGLTDVAGGAPNFRSTYVVASETYKGMKFTAGYGRGSQLYSGLFYGAEVPANALGLGVDGLSFLAENDSMMRRAGARYVSKPIPMLAHGRVALSFDHTLGGKASALLGKDRSTLMAQMVFPLGHEQWLKSGAQKAQGNDLIPMDALEKLEAALAAAGFERVRVGTSGSATSKTLVLEWEDHRRGRNSLDSYGIALGLALRHAQADISHLKVTELNNGVAVQRVTVPKQAWRDYLDGGMAAPLREALRHEWGGDTAEAAQTVQWSRTQPGGHARLRLVAGPKFDYFVGTEVGVFDAAYGLELRAQAPLPWPGLQAHGSYLMRLGETTNLKPPQIYAGSRYTSGLKTAGLSMTQWLAPQLLGMVSAGRLMENHTGVQGQLVWLQSGERAGDHVRGTVSVLNGTAPAGTVAKDIRAAQVAYRWNHNSTGLYADMAMNRYADGDSGPSASIGRWFGDIAAEMNYRRSSTGNAYIGVQIKLPLAPREGLAHRSGVSADLAPTVALGMQTLLASPGQCNCIGGTSATVVTPTMPLERDWLNQNRSGGAYMAANLYRMRDAWWRLGESN